MRLVNTSSTTASIPVAASERSVRVTAAIETLRRECKPIEVKAVAQLAGVARATLYRDKPLRDMIADASGVPYAPQEDDAVVRLRAAYERLQERNRRLLERDESVRERQDEWEQKLAREATRYRVLKSKMQKQDDLVHRLRTRIDSLKQKMADADETVFTARQSVRQAQQHAAEQEKLRQEAETREARQREANQTSAAVEEARQAGYKSGYEVGARNAMRAARRGITNSLSEAAVTMSPKSLGAARRQLARVLHPDLFAMDSDTQVLATELMKLINALNARSPEA